MGSQELWNVYLLYLKSSRRDGTRKAETTILVYDVDHPIIKGTLGTRLLDYKHSLVTRPGSCQPTFKPETDQIYDERFRSVRARRLNLTGRISKRGFIEVQVVFLCLGD